MGRRSITIAVLGITMTLVVLGAACAPGAAPTPTVAPAAPTATRPPAVPTLTLAPGILSPTSRPPTPTATRIPPTTTPTGIVTQYGGVLHLMLPGEPGHHDPVWPGSTQPHAFDPALEVLFRRDAITGEPVCELCEAWEFKDATTIVFKMRQGVKFHNRPPITGREMTAEDVVYSAGLYTDPMINSPSRSRYAGVSSIKSLDRYTVEMKLKQPSAGFMYSVASTLTILPREAIEKFGDFKDANNKMGTGPFLAGRYTPGVGGAMTRNPDYWQKGRPYLDGIDWILTTDQATVMAAWRTGRLDYGTNLTGGFTTGTQKRDLQRTNPDVEFFSIPNSYVNMLNIKLSAKPFDDLRVRKAIHLAMDRQEVLKIAVGGEDAGHVNGPMSWKLFPGWTYGPEELARMPGFRQPKDADIAEAKRLMAEAGYASGLTIPAEGCECFAFLNLAPMEIAKSQLRSIGITVNIRLLDQTQWFATDTSGDFLFRARGIGTALEPGEQLNTRHRTGAARNFQKYSNPEVDRLLDAQGIELDVAKRKQMMRQIQDILMRDLPQIWLITAEGFSVRQPWVQGFTPTVYQGFVAEDTWIDQARKRR